MPRKKRKKKPPPSKKDRRELEPRADCPFIYDPMPAQMSAIKKVFGEVVRKKIEEALKREEDTTK